MTNKFFMWLAGAVLLAALGVGVAFAGGVAYERSGADTSPVVTAPDLPSPSGSQGQPGGGRFNSEAIAGLQARLQSGSATPEDLQQLRQQFAGQVMREWPYGCHLMLSTMSTCHPIMNTEMPGREPRILMCGIILIGTMVIG